LLLNFRLVTKGTVDEDIYGIAKRKLILDAAVLESGMEPNDNSTETEVVTMGAILSAILDAAPS
jgi:SWI/SNF-related matrix-associated actin-dependent regulator 1 of chromatin subfamily A